MRRPSIKKIAGTLLTFVFALNCLAPLASAQANAKTLRGFTAENAKAQMNWETKMRATPKPENLREYMRVLSAEPHHVGSAYDKKNAEYIRDLYRSWGIKAELEEYDVLFPTPIERLVEMIIQKVHA